MGSTPGTEAGLAQRIPLVADAEHDKESLHCFAIIDAGSGECSPCCRGPQPGEVGYARKAENVRRLAKAAEHVKTQRAEDPAVFDRAANDDRVLVSADTDFGALLATRSARKPSVIQFRGRGSRLPEGLSRTILSNLPQLADALESGSIVTFEPSRVRVRALPINIARAEQE